MSRLSKCVAVVGALVAVTAPRAAEACTFFVNQAFVTDPTFAPDDTVAPAIVTAVGTVERFDPATSTCYGVALYVELAATDDRTAGDAIGFELTARAANVPTDRFTAMPVRPQFSGVGLTYNFGADIPRVDLTLDVVAIDLNGNRSAPVTLHIVEPEPEPEDDGGCAAGGGGGSGAGAIVVALAALIARRRRAWPRL